MINALKVSAIGAVDVMAIFLENRYKGFQTLKKGTLRKIISDMTKEGQIKTSHKQRYILTGLGVIRALPEIKKALTNDGKFRILVFDIPEKYRYKRDIFRRHIKLLGFQQHQQSVWVSQYDCEKWMQKIINYHEVDNYVSLYIGEHVW